MSWTAPTRPHRSVAEIAAAQGKDPVEVFIDLALDKGLKQFYLQPLANEDQDHALQMIKHPRSVVTFSDSGAHVSQIMDSSLQTHLLSHWVREKQAVTLEEAVRMLSFVPASQWGLNGRGLLREGMTADVVVFNPDTVAPMMPELTYDLPAGARRAQAEGGRFPGHRGQRSGCAAQQRTHRRPCPVSCCAVPLALA